MLHKASLSVLLFFVMANAWSQSAVVVTVLIPPPYSPYLQDYLQYENKMVIQLQNLTNQSLSIKLIGSMEGDNGILISTDEDYLPPTPITLPPNGFIRVPASKNSRGFFDPDHLNFSGDEELKNQILKDGILPEGNYMVCIQAVDYTTNAPLSDEAPSGCTLLPISYPTPTQLLSPECEGILESDLPFFQWSLPGGNTGRAALQYDLYIIEWLSGSNPEDLIQLAVDYNAGNAIIRRNLVTPTYQYQISDPKLREGAPYLWVVKVKDGTNTIRFENEGLSEMCTFTYNRSNTDLNTGITMVHAQKDIDIRQVRTRIEGQLNYKFPNGTNTGIVLEDRNLEIETEETPYQVANNMAGELSVFNEDVLALANHNYINAFPVSVIGSQPLKNMNVKLVESWVITDCDVTYMPQNRTVHKDFFILPNESNILGGAFGGTSLAVVIDGITNGAGENPLALGLAGINADAYSRVLSVNRTDGAGHFDFNFTQSSPGLMFTNYPGHASIILSCEPVDIPVEINDFVHPLDEVSNPADIYSLGSNPANVAGNPVTLDGESLPENYALRNGQFSNTPEGQLPYQSIEINGGHLSKVLRLEIASPFYYSPDLIFWTHPGDTMTLPDQVSYVKSVDLNLNVKGGRWEHNQNYQSYTEGFPVPNVDVLFSRKKEGLPAAIPIEEGQGLRDYEGEQQENLQLGGIHADLVDMTIDDMGNLYDSVSILRSGPEGELQYKRLVAGHPYYVKGSTPLDGAVNYEVPLQSRIYQVFNTMNCDMNLEMNLNSFCQHRAISITDSVTAYPLAPKVFGRVVTSTNDDKVPLKNVIVTLKRYENNNVVDWLRTYTDEDGIFHYENLPVNPNGNQDYAWKIFFEYSGYQDVILPANGNRLMRPGQQWDLEDVEMIPLGNLVGYIHDEDGQLIHALVRLADGPHIQTENVTAPVGQPSFCGNINGFGDAINESTKVNTLYQQGIGDATAQILYASQFKLPARSGNHLALVIVPLPEQYFQDTCYVDVDELSSGDFQQLGYITVKEKLHRISITVKGPEGQAVQAKVFIDDRVRQTNDLGFTAFRFASPETQYRVRIEPELATFVPVDTIMTIPISKTYLSKTFHLREGKKIKVLVIRDQSGQPTQSTSPIPIEGAVVQTLLSSSPEGNSYIQCITGPDGICTLEGVPVATSTVQVSAWKEDDEHLYIGKTVSIPTNRPLNPPFQIALKVMSGVTVPDIWGFPTAITGMEIRQGNGGTLDTLFEGILTSLPENNRFKSEEQNVEIPYPKIKFACTGERNDDGKKIMQPTGTGITLHQSKIATVLFDQFNVLVSPKRYPNYATSPYLSLQKTENDHGRISGVVETELSSFNFSYQYNGKFYLGQAPTEYNIDVFQSGMILYQNSNPPHAVNTGQEPEPGPDDFYLMNITPQNKPASHQFRVFQFEASSDSSRSFVSQEAFYIHTILHTDIPHVTPHDLQLSVGKIIITNDNIESFSNGFRKLDFKMGKYWKYYSTTPYHYDPDVGGITATSGYINTGQIDVPVQDAIIKPHQLIMSHINQIPNLTLAGIKDLPVEPGVNIILSKGIKNVGWMLTVQKRDTTGVVIQDAVVAQLKNLPVPFRSQDVIDIHTILLTSEKKDLDLTLDGEVRPYDICDFTVQSITTGEGYFILDGHAELGRDGMRVPGLAPSVMLIQYNGPKNNLTGKIVSPYAGLLETKGQVSFEFDYSDANTTRQAFSNRRFVTTGMFSIYEGGNTIKLKGILDLDYNDVRIHVINHDLNVPNISYQKVDQSIPLGNGNKALLVRSGIQNFTNQHWDFLVFKSNLSNFDGAPENQTPMDFTVKGALETENATLKVDNIDIGFAAIALTYDFAAQSLTGHMEFHAAPTIALGPVTVEYIEANILVDPKGFLFSAYVDGSLAGAFDLGLGVLLGSHSAVPDNFIEATLQGAYNQNTPATLADHSLHGFFITGCVYLANVPVERIDVPPLFYASGGLAAGFDARISMDFDESGDAAFDLEALAFAGAMITVGLYAPPGLDPLTPCDLEICLAGEAQLLIALSLYHTGGGWEFEGEGCGSLLFSGSLCDFDFDFGGKAFVTISSEHGADADIELMESCGGSNGTFTCE